MAQKARAFLTPETLEGDSATLKIDVASHLSYYVRGALSALENDGMWEQSGAVTAAAAAAYFREVASSIEEVEMFSDVSYVGKAISNVTVPLNVETKIPLSPVGSGGIPDQFGGAYITNGGRFVVSQWIRFSSPIIAASDNLIRVESQLSVSGVSPNRAVYSVAVEANDNGFGWTSLVDIASSSIVYLYVRWNWVNTVIPGYNLTVKASGYNPPSGSHMSILRVG